MKLSLPKKTKGKAAAQNLREFRVGRLPSKRSINLVGIGEKKINPVIAVPAIVLILVLACLFSKFVVVDRLLVMTRAQNKVESMQQELDQVNAEIASYGDILEEYAHYTYSDFTYDELNLAGRNDVLQLIDDVVTSRLIVQSYTVTENVLVLRVTGNTLQEINQTAQLLEAEEMVDFCTVTTANTNNSKAKNDTEGYTSVSGEVTVYLLGAMDLGE